MRSNSPLSYSAQSLLKFLRKSYGSKRHIFHSDIHYARDKTVGYDITEQALEDLQSHGYLRLCSKGLILMNWE